MTRWLALLYGGACYMLTGAVAVYAAGFLADRWAPVSAGRGGEVSVEALAVDTALIVLFGLQHSVMARTGFKRWWTRVIPQPVERSTYVLFSDLALIALFTFWQPVPETIWSVTGSIGRATIWTVAAAGAVLMLAATFAIDHWDLFGLRQVWAYFRGKTPGDIPFRVPRLYRFSRNPMMVGLLVALWCTPEMTLGRMIFGLGMTAYILIGIQFEERDMNLRFGIDYERYRRRVLMLIGRRKGAET
jgi:protein-S-isoprenylcysteine O-methyltransferase Ste14